MFVQPHNINSIKSSILGCVYLFIQAMEDMGVFETFKTVIICMPLVALKLLSSLLNTKQVIMLFHHENREVKNSFSVFCIGRILPCSSWLWGTLSPQTGTVGTSPRQHEQALPVLSRLHCGCVSRGKAQWYGVFRGVYPGKTTPHVWTVLKWC